MCVKYITHCCNSLNIVITKRFKHKCVKAYFKGNCGSIIGLPQI